MPVQINEVIIKAIVSPEGSAGSTVPTVAPASLPAAMESELAERVIEILKEKKER